MTSTEFRKITQSEFNKLVRILRQERSGHKFRLTLMENSGRQYIKICQGVYWIDLSIITVYDRTIYFIKYLQDDTPVVCKATFGIDFCKIMSPGLILSSSRYYHQRNPIVDSFFSKYKEIVLSGRNIGDNIEKTDDNNVESSDGLSNVLFGISGLTAKVNISDYRRSCPFYWNNTYFMSATITTSLIPWVKLFEWYIYDYGQSFYIFDSPFSKHYFRVHKENPIAFNNSIDMHLKIMTFADNQKSYDILIAKYYEVANNRPVDTFDFDHYQYSDMIIETII